jgi:hypothetical protein
MSELQRVGDLEIDQDLDFQRREWQIERILWAVVAVLLVLAVLGVFGTGPISTTTAESDDGTVVVDYHRFIRHDGRASLTLHVSGEQATDGKIEVWINHRYLDGVQVEDISPEPQEMRGAGDRVIYVFAIDAPGDDLTVTYALRPQHIGRLRAEIGAGNVSVRLNQVSYP